jgi:hypothetical protein
MDEKCSLCKRLATIGRTQVGDPTVWYCTMHRNRMIRDERIKRKLAKSRKNREP